MIHKSLYFNRKNELKEKVFVHRESLLTELFKINHIKNVRHVFISVLIIICFNILFYDFRTYGR